MFKKKPVSPGIDRPEDLLDPVDLRVYHLLFYVKMVLIALFTYLFILTLSEGVFMLQNMNDKAVGVIKKSRPWIEQPVYKINKEITHASYNGQSI